ncbi:MAG: acyl-CoA dehydrogenase [Caulobacter sp.]|nr:acyl-CoA dehydrogenase [Caulobacter sp.]
MAATPQYDDAASTASLRRLLERHWSASSAGDLEAVAAVWRLITDAGWHGLGLDPDAGGLRLVVDAMAEMGRAACPAPLLPAILANAVVGTHEDGAVTALVVGAFDGVGLSGSIPLIEDTAGATRLLILSPATGCLGLVTANAPGIRLIPTPGMAEPALATAVFDTVPINWLTGGAHGAEDLEMIYRLGLAARAWGSAERVAQLAIDHAKIRIQFGKPIGAFQAVQHKLADCRIMLEATRLGIENAAAKFDQGRPWRFAANAAIAFAGARLRPVALEAQHVLGAIGYAEEHEAPRHFRRIHVDLIRLGGTRRAHREVADRLFEHGFPQQSLGDAADTFAAEVGAWMVDNRPPAPSAGQQRAELDWNAAFSQALGRQGWVAAAWPEALGGQARAPIEQFAMIGALEAAEAPVSAHITSGWIVAPTLIAHGTEAQKARFLPPIARGELSFCLGYSEPEAGSDLGALRTRAVRDGDDYVVNGQKVWTSGGELADYVLLAARTDPLAARGNEGISLLMVPLTSPGITIRPSRALHGGTFCSVFYDDVRVPADLLIGEENRGWPLLGAALATERVQLGAVVARLQLVLERVIDWMKTSDAPGDPAAREKLGQLAADIEASRMLALEAVRVLEAGRSPVIEGAVTKVFTGELMERLCESALDIIGGEALLSAGSPGAALSGQLEQMLRKSLMYVIGGGTNEIQRTIIAQKGLGLPR